MLSPARSRKSKAFRVVISIGALPYTVVMPETSSAEAANRMATASSWPGSQSMMYRIAEAI
jgi:hypothetical protein